MSDHTSTYYYTKKTKTQDKSEKLPPSQKVPRNQIQEKDKETN